LSDVDKYWPNYEDSKLADLMLDSPHDLYAIGHPGSGFGGVIHCIEIGLERAEAFCKKHKGDYAIFKLSMEQVGYWANGRKLK